MPIPITVVLRDLGAGGTERHLLQVLPRLDPRRFAVELVPLRHEGGLRQAFADAGIPVFAVASGVLRWPAIALCLLGRIRARRPLVHAFLPEPYLLAPSAARAPSS